MRRTRRLSMPAARRRCRRKVGRRRVAGDVCIADGIAGDAERRIDHRAAEIRRINQLRSAGIDFRDEYIGRSRLDGMDRIGEGKVGRLGQAGDVGVSRFVGGDREHLVERASAEIGRIEQGERIDDQRPRLIVSAEREAEVVRSASHIAGADVSALCADELIRGRLLLAQRTGVRREHQIAARIDVDSTGAAERQIDYTGIRVRCNDQIVFELAAVAVADGIDALVDRGVANAQKRGDVGMPALRVAADVIVCPRLRAGFRHDRFRASGPVEHQAHDARYRRIVAPQRHHDFIRCQEDGAIGASGQIQHRRVDLAIVLFEEERTCRERIAGRRTRIGGVRMFRARCGCVCERVDEHAGEPCISKRAARKLKPVCRRLRHDVLLARGCEIAVPPSRRRGDRSRWA